MESKQPLPTALSTATTTTKHNQLWDTDSEGKVRFWYRAIDIHEQSLREQRELGNRDMATHMAVFLKWQRIANWELQRQRQMLEALMSERNPRQRRGRQGWERKSKQEERDLLIWSIMQEKPKSLPAYCRR